MNKQDSKDWIFTFGFGQYNGVHRNHFVRLHGTFEEARLEMFRRYGRGWAGQYASEKEAGVQEFGLTEVEHFDEYCVRKLDALAEQSL